jgi:hypothetical protein
MLNEIESLKSEEIFQDMKAPKCQGLFLVDSRDFSPDGEVG